MDSVYAIFDDYGDCVYLCYTDCEYDSGVCYEYCDQIEPMNDCDWEEWLAND